MSPCERRPAGLLLDVVGTVLQGTTCNLASGIQALNPLVDVDSLTTEIGSAIRNVRRSNCPNFLLSQWIAEKRHCFDREGSVYDLEQVVWRETFNPTLIPGIGEALTELNGRNIPVGCVSNTVFSGRALFREMQHFGLTSLIRFVLSSADYAIRKPDPEIFVAGAHKLGVEPSRTWFVGDTWETDIEGAAATGMFPVWFSSTAQPPRSGLRHGHAATWSEVCQLVKQIPD